MVNILEKWFPMHGQTTLLVMDAARQHWTQEVKATLTARKLISVRVPEGMTSFIQFLDAFWFFRFKANCRWQYALAMHGRGNFTAADQRVAMTLLVAEAHHETLKCTSFFDAPPVPAKSEKICDF